MQIIKWIKIRNFRSFTWIKSEAINLKDFNIFSWSNDSWKSNIFRALNLFFNNEITHWVPFNIERDFSEQKKVKKEWWHRVIEIRLDFELTTEWTRYLPKEFAIEKKYYRNNNFDYTFILKRTNWEEIKISSDPENNKVIKDKSDKIIISTNPDKEKWIDDEKQYRKQFNEFLWKITFEYIPAIRENRYFSYLFWRVISKIRDAEDERVLKIDEFINELNDPFWTIKKKKKLIEIREQKINWSKKKKWKEEYTTDYKDKMRKEIEEIKIEIMNLENQDYIETKLKEQVEYKTLKSEFKLAIDNLSSKINALSWDLFNNISFIENAEFAIADNLLDFFETFEIWTWDSRKISLKSRWDWMQSRFIPIILDFLSKVQNENEKWNFDWEYERNKYFIWWFEEPENSYEYSNSIRLANNFTWIKNIRKDENLNNILDINWKVSYEEINYSERKQIFITTHSEEFLRLFSEDNIKSEISLYLVEKQIDKSSLIRYIEKKDLKDVHNNLWLENIARSKLIFDIKDKIKENTSLKNEIEELFKKFKEIEKSKKNILYVEDQYINIYKIAYLKVNQINFNDSNFEDIFNKKANFDIFWNEWKSELRFKLDRVKMDEYDWKKLIWLFDFDSSFNDFNWLNKWRWTKEYWNDLDWWVKSRSDYYNIFALLLPVPKLLKNQAWISFKESSLLEIEMYFHECWKLKRLFCNENIVWWWTVLKFTWIKSEFWRELLELEFDDFKNFKSLFSKIDELFSI